MPVIGRSQLRLAALLALGCGVQERATPMERAVPFACEADTDCPAGSCLAEYGVCTRETGRLENLLFEVTPQASDPVYGGARFLTVQNVSQPPAVGERLGLNVRQRVQVTGRVLAAQEQAACLSLARSTLPVRLTFTPREHLLGLSLPSYELETVFDPTPGVREYVFQGALPPGRYDVYMRPDTAALGEDCRAIPQIFRDRAVGLVDPDAPDGAASGNAPLELQQPPPSALRLTINWSDRLEGWRLDMVHPVTGEVLSNRVTLRASDVDAATQTLVTTLDYSQADPDFITQGEELVRFTPPSGIPAGTVLMQRYGLELVTPGEGAIGNVATFGVPVDFQAWVWKQGLSDAPVPGDVSFSSISLDDVEDGVFAASFEASAGVDATGQVNTLLLPGRYRVRITPPGLPMVDLGIPTGFESTITVWPNGDPALERQGGHVIDVPPALSLGGRVIAETNGMPLRRVEVVATASNPERNLCAAPTPEQPMPKCERPGAPVLQRARAEDPFIPRTRTVLTEPNGSFTIDGLDCGRCDPEQAVRFDLTVRPDQSSGLPWVVHSAVDPYADREALSVEALRVPMPVARPMQITYGTPLVDPGQDLEDPADDVSIDQYLSGALVRVFAMLDNQGVLVTNPDGLVPCVALPEQVGTRCLQSLLQVAEARTGSEGDFLLLLPPDVE